MSPCRSVGGGKILRQTVPEYLILPASPAEGAPPRRNGPLRAVRRNPVPVSYPARAGHEPEAPSPQLPGAVRADRFRDPDPGAPDIQLLLLAFQDEPHLRVEAGPPLLRKVGDPKRFGGLAGPVVRL